MGVLPPIRRVIFCVCGSTASLSQTSNSRFITNCIKEDGEIIISSQEVIKNPFQLDGAKKPVKEMTVAELEAKLGHPVKVIKG